MIMFKPNYLISNAIQDNLKRIETAKNKTQQLLPSIKNLYSLREPIEFVSPLLGSHSTTTETHTHIREHVEKSTSHNIKTYNTALEQIEAWAANAVSIDEEMIQTLHHLMIDPENTTIKPTPYRNIQNYLRNNKTLEIVRTPPNADDVPMLMSAMVNWINNTQHIATPIVAGIALFQFSLIHPYNDGNGRTGRLLATLILHLRGYGLKGLYNLEKRYCRDLRNIYKDNTITPSQSNNPIDFTSGLVSFLDGLATTFEQTLAHVANACNLEVASVAE